MIKASNLLCVLLGCISFSAVSSFAFGGAKSSGAADQAVQVFAKRFPFDRPPPPKTNTAGVPYADIDGTVIQKGKSGKRLTDLSEKEVRSNFNEMAKVYGEQQALDMVTIMPIALTFNSKNFAPALKGYSAVFGEEDAKAMVGRNPGLLAVKPKDAEAVTDQAMTFSYIIAATRPLGGFGLAALGGLLALPVAEGFTREPIRANLLINLGLDPTFVNGIFPVPPPM